MSVSRINNIYNLSPKLSSVGHLNKIPVVFIDSKGRYLKEQVQNEHPANRIVYTVGEECACVEKQFAWLRDNLQSELFKLYTDLIICIWS